MTNDSCLTVREAKQFLAAFATFPAIALLSYMLSIIMIVRVSAYRKFSHRLILYLAIAGIARTVGLWFELLPMDIEQPDDNLVSVRDGWEGFCSFAGFFSQYAIFLVSFVVVWICLHIFVFVVFKKSLSSPKQEVFGAIAILLVPFLVSWEPFIDDSYGLSSFSCWIKGPCVDEEKRAKYYIILLALVPVLLLRLMGIVLVLAAILSLCRSARKGLLKYKHWMAIKEILPLTLFPALFCAVDIGRIIANLAGDGTDEFYALTDTVTICLFNVVTVTMPLALILQPQFRQELMRKRPSETIPPAAAERSLDDDYCSDYGGDKGDDVNKSILLPAKEANMYSSVPRTK